MAPVKTGAISLPITFGAPVGAALADPAQVAKAATTNDASKIFFIGRLLVRY